MTAQEQGPAEAPIGTLDAVVAAIPGGVVRPEQAAMTRAVAAAASGGDHLLVQAGTGTGKSLAYLCGSLPALRRREAGTRRPRVMISTATLALQRQLVESDLPRLVDGLRAASPGQDVPRYAVLKGRSNYACLHRVREGVPDEQGQLIPAASAAPAGSLGAEVLALRDWAQRQAAGADPMPPGGVRGDRDAAPEHGARAWQQVSVSARECLGQSCPYVGECFAELAREKAAGSEIVVTNHALLAVDAVENVPVLPAYDLLVVDEAHELAARFTASASGELSMATVERAARRAAGVVVDEDGAQPLAQAGPALAAAMAQARPDVRLDADWQADQGSELMAAVAAVRDGARTALSALPGTRSGAGPGSSSSGSGSGAGDEGVSAAVRVARGAVEEVFTLADRMAAGSGGDVLWVSDRIGGPMSGRSLSVAPLGVAGLIRDRLLTRATTVLTSATLTVGAASNTSPARSACAPASRWASSPVIGAVRVAPARTRNRGGHSTSGPRSTTRGRGSSTALPHCHRRAAMGWAVRPWPRSSSWSTPPVGERWACSAPVPARSQRPPPCARPVPGCRCSVRTRAIWRSWCAVSSPIRGPVCSAPSRCGRAWTCPVTPAGWCSSTGSRFPARTTRCCPRVPVWSPRPGATASSASRPRMRRCCWPRAPAG